MVRVEHGHTINMKRTSSAPASQDRKTFAAASVACRGRRCRTRQTNQVVSASPDLPNPAPAVYQPVS